MRFRYSVTDPERTRKLTAPFAALFNPLIVVAVTAAFLAACWWVLMVKGLASATHEAFANPGLVLLILAVTVLSAGFHEFGHAAAARRGGATPGAMGAGLYLMWPAFYTDVTDSYRLGRGGRLRTDLGGLYFNAIVAVAIMGIWWATGFDALLLVVVTQILQMVRQLLPLVRFDGYHILADATGVPDLFQRIKPTLLGLLPWRWDRPRSQAPEAVGAGRGHRSGCWSPCPCCCSAWSRWCSPCRGVLGTAWDSGWKQQAMLADSVADRGPRRRRRAGAGDRLPCPAGAGHLLHPAAPGAARSPPACGGKPAARPLQRATAMAAVAAVAGRPRLGLVARRRDATARCSRTSAAPWPTPPAAVFPAVRRTVLCGRARRADRGAVAGGSRRAHRGEPAAEHGPGAPAGAAAGQPAPRTRPAGERRGAVLGVPLRPARRSRGRTATRRSPSTPRTVP